MNIVAGGLACLDIVKIEDREVIMLGGTAINVTSILSMLGEGCSFLCAAYNGEIKNQFRNEFEKRNINIIEFTYSKKTVPRIIENIECENHMFEIVCPKCKRKLCEIILPTEKQIEKLQINEKYNLLYFDRISSGIKKMLTQSNAGWKMYEPNSVRKYDVLLHNARLMNIIKISADRIPKKYIENIVHDLNESDVKLIIVSLGMDGLKFSIRMEGQLSNWHYLSSYKQGKVIDTSGAGDWLTGIFLFKFLKEYPTMENDIDIKDVIDILKLAQKVAALSCSYIGAQGLLYDGDGVQKLNDILNSKLKKLEFESYVNYGCSHCWIEQQTDK